MVQVKESCDLFDSLKELLSTLDLGDLEKSSREDIAKLLDLQREHAVITSRKYKEELQLQLKYESLYAPIYAKRAEIVSGNISESTENGTSKGIPGFWYKTILPLLGAYGMDFAQDEPALKYLLDIRCEYVDSTSSICISFEFAPNPFFENKVLTKTFLTEKKVTEDEFEDLDGRSLGTEIKWFPGKNLTVKSVTKTQRHRTKNVTRTVTREESVDSFFNFFKPVTKAIDSCDNSCNDCQDDHSNEEDDDECSRGLTEVAFAETLRDRIIPRALSWYLGLEGPSEEEDIQDYSEEYEEDISEEEEEFIPQRGIRATKSDNLISKRR